jgi:predicted enzyme related to lactoylglutathione lyase
MSASQPRPHAAVWVEIPANDLDRATRFYETILATDLRREKIGPSELAVLPYGEAGSGGAIVKSADLVPSTSGTLVFLNCDQGLDQVLARVETAGGTFDGTIVTLPGDMGR